MPDSLSMYHSKEMKKFIRYTILFVATIALLDMAFGYVNRAMEKRALTANYHCCYEATEDILVLGSSYAVREIVPSILTDSLGLSCYNAGEAGNGALGAWVRYNMFLRNHTPKLILYALTPGFDYINKGSDYTEYLKSFKAYYGIEPTVNEIYSHLGDRLDGIKLHSAFVRYNSIWIITAKEAIRPSQENPHGYNPFYNTFTPYTIPDSAGTAPVEIDKKKFAYFDSLMRDATSRGIRVICFLPPHYYPTYHAQSHEPALSLCRELNIPVINNYNDSYYRVHSELFGDKEHLNHQGAQVYTAQLCDSIQQYFKQEK